MANLLKIIHNPHREEFSLETVFFLLLITRTCMFPPLVMRLIFQKHVDKPADDSYHTYRICYLVSLENYKFVILAKK